MRELNKLVQNYYELHGSFTGIETTSFFKLILDITEGSEDSIQETLFKALGYEPIILPGGETLLASEVFEVRLAWIRSDHNKVLEIFGRHSKMDAEEVNEFIINKKLMPLEVGSRSSARVDEDLQEYVEVLTKYYTTCEDNLVYEDNQLVPFSYLLDKSRQEGISLKGIKELTASHTENLVDVKCGTSKTYITNHTLYAKENLSQSMIRTIQQRAIQKAIYPGFNLKKDLVKNAHKLCLVSDSQPDLYKALLEWSAYEGITYAELLGSVGLTIRNLEPVWKKLNAVIIVVGDVAIIYRGDEVKRVSKEAAYSIIYNTTVSELSRSAQKMGCF